MRRVEGLRWRVPRVEVAEERALAERCGISPVLARILLQRGIRTAEEARVFLLGGPEQQELSPWLLADMEVAVERVLAALERGESILIWGDYDVDGMTSTAVLSSFLRACGGQVDFFLPNRLTEGYGLQKAGLEKAAREGFGLIITVDCGISAVPEVEYARALGLEVVICDHHSPGPSLPSAAAVVDPRRRDCPYPYKELAGVGVTFKLCQALAQRLGRDPGEVGSWADLVMLGTVADVMPLTGENRALVRRGLQALPSLRRPGLVALAQVAGYSLEEMDAGRVAFGLAPRLNAAGRLGETELGVRLLLASDSVEAQFLAQKLEEANRKRQELEGKILAEAEAMVAAEVDLKAEKVLLLAARGWHPGVIGIVAARLVEKYHRPACLVALEDGWGRGSGRSIPAFNLHTALLRCADLLAGFGGHAQAAGFAVAEAALPELRSRLNQVADEVLRPEDLQPELTVDAVVAPQEIGVDLAEELRLLEPCGTGNPEPVLALRGVKIRRCHRIGTTGSHLRLRLTAGEGLAPLDAIGWGLGKEAELLGSLQGELEVAFHLEVNTWRGEKSPRLVLCALRPLRVEPALRGQRPAFYLIDGRGYPREKRPAYLERLLAIEERLLVYAGEREALELASLYPGQLSVYREGGGEEAFQAMERWRYGDVPALAVVGPVNRQLSAAAAHLVFYTLPLSRWDFLRVGGWVAEAGGEEVHIHLLFGWQDVEAARAFVHRTAPDRELLRAIYRQLRAAADGTGRVVFPFPTGEALAGWREVAAAAETISTALEIFSELGLVEREGAGEKGEGEIVRLRPAPAQKLDLRLSVRYNECVNKIENFEEFHRWILRAPATTILDYLRKELRMHGSAGAHPRDT